MALRVLLADDEKEFVETLAERLDLRGIEVRVALDGKAALTLSLIHIYPGLSQSGTSVPGTPPPSGGIPCNRAFPSSWHGPRRA